MSRKDCVFKQQQFGTVSFFSEKGLHESMVIYYNVQ